MGTNAMLPAAEFLDTYGAMMESLDGTDPTCYVDFYFERCRVNSGLLRFQDQLLTADFYDACVEMGLAPPLSEVCTGEAAAAAEKRYLEKRDADYEERERQRARRRAKAGSPAQRQSSKAGAQQRSLEALRRSLETETCPQKLQAKLLRSSSLVQSV